MLSALYRYQQKQERLVLGLMSGTSADAVDAVLVNISGSRAETRWRILIHHAEPLTGWIQDAILQLSAGRSVEALIGIGPAAQLATMNSLVGEAFAQAALCCCARAGIPPRELDLVASHGQTVCHLPSTILSNGERVNTTLQIGSGAVIACRVGAPVLTDFRSADMALGGQGAPLVPYADRILFSQPGQARAIQNLGGIGNVTYLAPDPEDDVIAFDTGPGNILMDAAVRRASGGTERFDREGRRARNGQVSTTWLAELMEHPYLRRSPPKSTGHEAFGEPFFEPIWRRADVLQLSVEDRLSTLLEFTVLSVQDAYRRFLPFVPQVIILGGGGSANPEVVQRFGERFPGVAIRRHEDYGIPAQAKEALAFCILANESLLGQPGTLKGATGATAPAILGCLYPGSDLP